MQQTREQAEASGTSLREARAASVNRELPVYDSAKQPHPFLEEWQELWRYRDLVFQWSGRNIKLRYKRSALGVLWTLLEPLMLMLILTVVFSTVFRPMEAFPVYLLAGLILFDFFNRSTLLIVEEIIVSQSLAERVHVPRSAFAVAAVLTYLTHWAIAHVPLIAIMIYFGRPFSWSLLSLPFGMLLAAMFALGVGLVVATLGAFFHDIRLTYQVLLTGWFYATPVIYPLDVVPEHLQVYFRLNPMYLLLRLVRLPVYDGVMPSAGLWAAGFAVSFSTLMIGWWTFTRWRNAFDYRS
ncbi:MAG: ABC transporter permease [Thermoanaerobaculia bacterium]